MGNLSAFFFSIAVDNSGYVEEILTAKETEELSE